MNTINVSKEAFKKIKKNKKIYYVIDDTDYNINEKVIINYNNKKKKRKIKNIYNINDNNINNKYLYNIDNPEGSKAITFKHKISIIKFILLFILVIGLFGLYITYGKQFINDMKVSKIQNKIDKIKDEEPTYIVVKINPSLMIELIDNKVNSSYCLNDDCKRIYDLNEIKGLDLDNTIDKLYNTAKDKGINVSNGVNLYSNKNIKIDKPYTNVEQVTSEEISNYLKETDIKNDYDSDLLKIYESDSDYGKLYTCSNNGKLACYITDEFYKELSSFAVCEDGGCPGSEYFYKFVDFITNITPKLDRVLRKFNVETYYKEEAGYRFLYGMVFEESKYSFGSNSGWGISAPLDDDGNKIGKDYEVKHHGFFLSLKTYDELKVVMLDINKINLVDLSYNKNDLIVWDRRKMPYYNN